MSKVTIVLLIILAILLIAMVVLYFVGKRLQARQEEQTAQIEASKQRIDLLVIDKKRMKLKESGLPQQVIDGTPWYARRGKVPVVRVKAGPQVLNMVCDDAIFDAIPVKQKIRAEVSGIYIVSARGSKGQKLTVPDDGKKKGFWRRTLEKVQEKAGAKPVK